MDEVRERMTLGNGTEENKKNQEPLSEECFRQLYSYDAPEEVPLTHKLKNFVKCDKECLKNVLPILKWLKAYKKSDLLSDVTAGLTVGVMHIPQGMAYALLGDVPPVIGMYMAFFPVLIYILMGTSPHVSMGTFAVVCMMVGKSVNEFSGLAVNNSTEYFVGEPSKFTATEVASSLCLIVGIWQVLLSIFKLGSLTVLLSNTLVSSFTTGAAVHVLTSQIKNLLGIEVKRYSGPFQIIYKYIDIFSNLKNVNVVSFGLSLSFIALLITYNEFIRPFLQKKFKKNILFPIELLVVILGIILSINLKVNENYGVSIVNHVPKGLPYPTIPPLSLFPKLLTEGLIVAVVAVSINVSMASIFAQKFKYEIDGNQEILASGVGNVFSSFFSCMPYAVSLSRSLVQVSAGCRTLLTSAVSACFMFFVLLFVGPYFEPLPYCVLSTIIVVALKGMFVQIKDVPTIFRMSRVDGLVWVVTFLSVVILDISYGLGIGLLASIASLLISSKNYEIISLGYVPGTKTYLDVDQFKKAQLINNVLILRIVGGINFANARSIKNRLLKFFLKFSKNTPSLEGEEGKHRKNIFLVIDMSSVPFIDPSGVKSFKSLLEDLKTYDCNLLFCGCNPSVYKVMERCNFFDEFLKSSVIHDLNDAVEYVKKSQWKFSSPGDLIIKF